ncbi:MAG: hypothetical protein A3E84_05480 [Gammaproteobacteria bacterium RIFCSPHIGHO2_12_FULL_42_13]|nr:MAG: hypothetical protein A3E84_05480 [Gammaproteobacteria bacterium RIFCSPHIGHO2_12_FULL_42_13]
MKSSTESLEARKRETIKSATDAIQSAVESMQAILLKDICKQLECAVTKWAKINDTCKIELNLPEISATPLSFSREEIQLLNIFFKITKKKCGIENHTPNDTILRELYQNNGNLPPGIVQLIQNKSLCSALISEWETIDKGNIFFSDEFIAFLYELIHGSSITTATGYSVAGEHWKSLAQSAREKNDEEMTKRFSIRSTLCFLYALSMLSELFCNGTTNINEQSRIADTLLYIHLKALSNNCGKNFWLIKYNIHIYVNFLIKQKKYLRAEQIMRDVISFVDTSPVSDNQGKWLFLNLLIQKLQEELENLRKRSNDSTTFKYPFEYTIYVAFINLLTLARNHQRIKKLGLQLELPRTTCSRRYYPYHPISTNPAGSHITVNCFVSRRGVKVNNPDGSFIPPVVITAPGK